MLIRYVLDLDADSAARMLPARLNAWVEWGGMGCLVERGEGWGGVRRGVWGGAG